MSKCGHAPIAPGASAQVRTARREAAEERQERQELAVQLARLRDGAQCVRLTAKQLARLLDGTFACACMAGRPS